jgi:CubicO group peptidase (beta-lactamase class C family)
MDMTPLHYARTARALAVFAALGLAGTGRAADVRPQIDKIAQPLVEGKKGVGLVVAIATKDGQQVFGYGKVALAGGEQTPDGDTLFEIGSITKTFTALVLAEMVATGLVKLEDPVRLYLPADVKVPKRGDKEITLLHLATHTSGLPRLPTDLIAVSAASQGLANPYAHYTLKHLSRMLAECKLEHDPGEEEDYSNLGAGLLGLALTRAAKAKDYEELVVKRVCEPLGMKDTRLRYSEEQRKRFPAGFNGEGKPTAHWDFQSLEGCGALRSSATDMLAYLSANLGVKKTRLLAAMQTCQQEHEIPGSKGLRLPLAWVPGKLSGSGKPMLWHNGGTFGAHSYLGFLKNDAVGVLVLCNAGQKIGDNKIEKAAEEVLELLSSAK